MIRSVASSQLVCLRIVSHRDRPVYPQAWRGGCATTDKNWFFKNRYS